MTPIFVTKGLGVTNRIGTASWIAISLFATGCKKSASPDPAPSRGDSDGSCLLVEDGFGPEGDLDLEVSRVASGLRVPWGVAFLPGGDILVTERAGAVRLVRDGKLVKKPVAEIEVVSDAEGGLLGLTLDPDFDESRAFYIYFTAAGGNRVERWVLAGDHASAGREAVLIDSIPAARFHDGGFLTFGPDGMLYVGTGDARDPDKAQDRGSLAGKILRITRDGEPAPGNPWPDNPAYVIGVRNTQGFGWLDSGALVVADHGPSGELGRRGHDEVTVIPPDAIAGANLGWPEIYGCQEREGMLTPAISFAEAVPPGGATIYRGDAIRRWRGDVILGTLGSRHLHQIALAGDGTVEAHYVFLRDRHGRLRTVVNGPNGALYALTSNCDDRGECPAGGDSILRITAASN